MAHSSVNTGVVSSYFYFYTTTEDNARAVIGHCLFNNYSTRARWISNKNLPNIKKKERKKGEKKGKEIKEIKREQEWIT